MASRRPTTPRRPRADGRDIVRIIESRREFSAHIGEETLTILARAGITGDAAVATFSGIVALNYGWVSFAIARDSDGGSNAVQQVIARSASAADYPITDDVSDPMSRYASDEHYETVQSQLLFGVKAMALA